MSTVKTKVIRIGNSRGIRIPKVILDQCHVNDEVELETKEDSLVIKSPRSTRDGCDLDFRKMHENKEDLLMIDDSMTNDFDKEEWGW